MDLFDIFHSGLLISVNTSAGLSLLIVVTQKWHGRFSHDTHSGPQKFHHSLTPRVGGIAIFIALIVSLIVSPGTLSPLLKPILIAGLPVFVLGVAEDLSKRVKALQRLLAAIVTATAAWWFTGYSLNHLDLLGVDYLLSWLPLSVAFTAFAVAGLTNAINIIDGFNGLAGGTVIIALSALGVIAWQVSDTQLAQLCLTVIVVLIGFMLFNYPFGKIFLGDGGAYLIGFILAWVAVMLPMRNPQVSVWASLLVCSYPINEAVFSMTRRFWNKTHLHEADSNHMHSLIKKKIVRPNFSHQEPWLRNSLVAPFCWSYALIFALIAITLQNNTPQLMAAWLASFALYAIIYRLLTQIKIKPTKQ